LTAKAAAVTSLKAAPTAAELIAAVPLDTIPNLDAAKKIEM
jgi:hypothetical protein